MTLHLAFGIPPVSAGPIHLESPVWLLLVPVLGVWAYAMSRRSLAGLGGGLRRVSLGVRVLVILLVCGALSEPSLRRQATDVSVMVIVDASESVPMASLARAQEMVGTSLESQKRAGDRLGVVTAARDAVVMSLPTPFNREVTRTHTGRTDSTNLAAGVRLALAVMPKDAANRILLVSDGNETVGGLLQAAETARALGIPIDVAPIEYRYADEVIVDRLVAPASAREGETMNLRVVVRATRPTVGRLSITQDGDAIDLSPGEAATSVAVALKEGLNVFQASITADRNGPREFRAVFEPEREGGRVVGDTILENNQALAVTFVAGEGRALVLTENENAAGPFLEALARSNIRAEVKSAAQGPTTLTEMSAYDVIIMMDQPAYGFSQKQQSDFKQYVHDVGGGLVVLGGPNALGAGGWIGSPLEDALPVTLDIPQKRQMPRGALALVIHSCEMPEGVFYGKKVCEAAVNSLSRLDLAGIIEYSWSGATTWVHPLSPVGDGSAINRSIQNLMFGDMPDFTPSVQLALEGLSKADAGQKHVIMISDGDPQMPSDALLDKFVEARITISTVGVFPHSGMDTARMQRISQYTKGRHYVVDTQAALATIPQIFVKEAQTIRRSLIWEGNPFTPSLVMGLSDSLRGISQAPALNGYVVTGEREGLALVSMKGKEGDPILAQWQYGLGKVLVYTSDATTRWNPQWVAWPNYRAFWEQNTRWAMRPGGSANVRVVTENRGDQTLITVEALDAAGERLNFANFRGRLAAPDGSASDIELRQVGPGRYQGVVPSEAAGSYVMGLRYVAPDERSPGGVLEGTVQAAITRPFADEYRALEDNSALLTQVAQMTGGRVIRERGAVDLWTREGVELPVALRPIWLAVALAGLGLFLADVAVRRVRIDVRAMARAVRGAFGRGRVVAGEMGGLKAARDQARAKMDGREDRQAVQARAARAREVARAKFEATPEMLREGERADQGAPIAVKPAARPPVAEKGSPPAKPGEGLSRLKQAKQKARDEIEEQ
ncbi:MAG: VWA domain-containing protein [Phycisphaeraceae bacterium]|nr:VWA domain-containing protein [Phycisphaeraceae bacterium]